jgi:hypothetical protein
MTDPKPTSRFLPIPGQPPSVRLLGPRADQAQSAARPLTPLDQPIGAVRSFLGALCDASGACLQPLELFLLQPSEAPQDQALAAATVRALHDLSTAADAPPVPGGLRTLRELAGTGHAVGPLLYCRKRHVVFEARSPRDARPLTGVPEGALDLAEHDTPRELLVWDGPADGPEPPRVYAARIGPGRNASPAGLDQLALDQGAVVRTAASLRETDSERHRELTDAHPCCLCPEQTRCYPREGGYAYASDRLAPVHALHAAPIASLLGEWTLHDAARIIGGLAPAQAASSATPLPEPLEAWRRARTQQMDQTPPRLLSGEMGGRQLLEIARLRLRLMADALEQLDALWRWTRRAHLCWNDETLRVLWQPPGSTPASCWGFTVLVRKGALQPRTQGPAGVDAHAYPPLFSDDSLLAPETLAASRKFGQPLPANVFVRSAKPDRATARVHLLLEDINVPRNAVCPADRMHVEGPGWSGTLAPAPSPNEDDGPGLPFLGALHGDVAALRDGEQISGCSCTWYAHFDQAVDLHALGLLLIESLLATDERPPARVREALATERSELTQRCGPLPRAQRDAAAAVWIAARCEQDGPAALWSRRHLLWTRGDRLATKLDDFPPPLWQGIVTFALRCITGIPGFSFCDDRSCAAPRAGQELLPLAELEGLIALIDDLMLHRTAPGKVLRISL